MPAVEFEPAVDLARRSHTAAYRLLQERPSDSIPDKVIARSGHAETCNERERRYCGYQTGHRDRPRRSMRKERPQGRRDERERRKQIAIDEALREYRREKAAHAQETKQAHRVGAAEGRSPCRLPHRGEDRENTC